MVPLWWLPLLTAGEVLQPIDTFADLTGWTLAKDGGVGLSFAAERTVVSSPPGALRLTFRPGGGSPWGNVVHAVQVPPEALAVQFRLQVRQAEGDAGLFVWLFEPDGDGWLAAVRPGDQPLAAAPRNTWLDVRVPVGSFHHDPRGDRRRGFLAADRIYLGVNNAPLEVVIDDLAWVVATDRATASLPRSERFEVTAGAQGNVVLLDEPALPRTAGALDLTAARQALTAAGYGVTLARAGDLADPQRLQRGQVDLVVLPAPAWPAALRENLLAYLHAGGALLTVGGYAFDDPQAWSGDGWVPVGSELLAREVDTGRPDALLNSRIGKPGDTMALPADRIGLFDPRDTLELVDHAMVGERRVRAPLAGWAAQSLAGENSPVFPTTHGESWKIGQTYDRLGRPRGALGVVCQLFAGPFAGAAWGAFGVSSHNLFAPTMFGPAPLLQAVEALVAGTFVHSLTLTPVTVQPGEPVRATVQVRNRGRQPRTVTVAVGPAGQPPARQPVTVAAGQQQPVTVTLPAAPANAAVVPVEAALSQFAAGGAVRSGYCQTQPAVVASGARLVWRNNRFELGGRPVFLGGTNQTGLMWATLREHPATWADDFANLRDQGFVVWRILHFSTHSRDAAGTPPERNPVLLAAPPPARLVQQTDAIVQTAQQQGVVILLCAHDWMGVSLSDEQLAAQRTWNRFWAARYKDVPGLIWDVSNEPSVNWGKPPEPHVLALCDTFLTARFGTLAAAREALGLTAEQHLLTHPGSGGWDDQRAVLTEQFRTWLLDRWVAANLAGLREGDPDAAVTVGYLQMRHNADKVNGAARLTFSNQHSYDPARQFAASLAWIDRRAYGQGLSLGEFGSVSTHNHRAAGGHGDKRGEDANRFATTLATTLGMGGAFAANWCWRDYDDVVFPWGLFRADGVPRPWLAEFRAITWASRLVAPRDELPALAVLLPDSQRLGPRFNEFDRALTGVFETLLGLQTPFCVLHENDLRQIPAAVRQILWPLPYCPEDTAFEAVRAWVNRGGQLYVSGGLGYDAGRRPTREARYGQLNLPPQPARDPFSVAASGAAPVQAEVGAGRVWFVPEPAELGPADRLREGYARWLAAAGATRLPVTPDDPDIHTFRLPAADGLALWSVTNWGTARTIGLAGGQLPVAANQAGLLIRSTTGVRAVLTHGPAQFAGAALASGPALWLALDDRDLAASRSLLLLPLAPGELRLRSPGWTPLTAAGEIRAGRWQRLDQPAVNRRGEELLLTADATLVGTPILLGDAAGLAAAQAWLERELARR
ncbi:MAG: hypothetical protein IT204_17160 [Fimbriimonadaceae bacterium]|nr:hypothetical protein [Fimbriimonadaceae bacterium]